VSYVQLVSSHVTWSGVDNKLLRLCRHTG